MQEGSLRYVARSVSKFCVDAQTTAEGKGNRTGRKQADSFSIGAYGVCRQHRSRVRAAPTIVVARPESRGDVATVDLLNSRKSHVSEDGQSVGDPY
jgi:hypothetical protein